jgi:hypothetical protein
MNLGKSVLKMGKVKLKFILEQAMKTQKGNIGIASYTLSLNSAMDGE